jgi:ubiquinone biosynthesis protein Coq4
MNLRKMIQTIRAYRAGAPLGDVVVLKIDAFSAPPRDTVRRLERVRGYAPKQDLAWLRTLPPGSLGREYARFLDANGIEPLVVSAELKERFRDNPYALRNVGQGSAPLGRVLLWGPRVVWALLSPAQSRRIWHNLRVGLAMGRRAALVIAEPIESWFEEPLGEVRARLGIPDPRAANVLPSRPSLLGDLLYPKKKLA